MKSIRKTIIKKAETQGRTKMYSRVVAVAVTILIASAALGGAALLQYYNQHTTTIAVRNFIVWDGQEASNLITTQTFGNCTPGYTYNETHNLTMLNDVSQPMNIYFQNSTLEEGITLTVAINNMTIDISQPYTLQPGTIYNVTYSWYLNPLIAPDVYTATVTII